MFKRVISGGVAGLSLSLLAALSVPQTANAATCTFDDGGAGLQAVFDGITTDPAGSSNFDVTTDCLGDLYDSKWSIGGTGSSIGTVIGMDGSAHFGIYDPTDPSKKVEIFAGASPSGEFNVVSLLADGSVFLFGADSGIDFASNEFGYYIEFQMDDFLYSDSSLNPGGIDRMYAYSGNGDEIQILPWAAGTFGAGEYILAWDNGNGDGLDFEDLVVMVESVRPHDPPGSSSSGGGTSVPEPAMLGLLGLGFAGIGFASRRRKSA